MSPNEAYCIMYGAGIYTAHIQNRSYLIRKEDRVWLVQLPGDEDTNLGAFTLNEAVTILEVERPKKLRKRNDD